MDSAVVADRSHRIPARLPPHPDATLPTAETGTLHPYCRSHEPALKSIVIAVSSRRSLITVYVDECVIPLKVDFPAIIYHRQSALSLCKIRQTLIARFYANRS